MSRARDNREAALDETTQRYEEHARTGRMTRWSAGGGGWSRLVAERDRAIVDALDVGTRSVVVDLGCGSASIALAIEGRAGRPLQYLGVDLLEERIAAARSAVQWATLRSGARTGSRWGTAWRTGCSPQPCSVLSQTRSSDARSRSRPRVLRPDGRMVIYDLRYSSPANRAVRPISEADLRRWFAGWPLETRTISLLPPLARRFIAAGPRRYALSAVPVLRSDLLATLTRP